MVVRSLRISTGTLLEATEQNFIQRALTFAQWPGGAIHGPNPLWVASGSRLAGYNGVPWASFTAGEVEVSIRNVIRAFRRRRLSFHWWVGPTSRPANLGSRLQANGFAHIREMLGMAASIDALQSPYDTLPSLSFEPVEDREGLRVWDGLYSEGFHTPPALAEESFNVQAAISFDYPVGWNHFIARENGRVVGVSSLLVTGETAGLYNLVTPESERGRGVGAAVTLLTFDAARQMGCRIATLQTSNPEAIRLYHRLGFEAYCRFSIYRYTISRLSMRRLLRLRWN